MSIFVDALQTIRDLQDKFQHTHVTSRAHLQISRRRQREALGWGWPAGQGKRVGSR
jgi:hypothetical protein